MLATRRKRAVDRRQQNANLIFRDIKAPGPEPVETLTLRADATVLSHEDLQSVMLHEPQAFDPTRPVHTDVGPLVLAHAEPDQLWLDTEGLLPSIGSQVTQITDLAPCMRFTLPL